MSGLLGINSCCPELNWSLYLNKVDLELHVMILNDTNLACINKNWLHIQEIYKLHLT